MIQFVWSRERKKRRGWAVILLVWIVCAAGCGTKRSYTEEQIGMGTFIRMTVVPDSESARVAVTRTFAGLREWERRLSNYTEDSEISQVNATAAVRPVPVSAELFAVLQAAQNFSEMTGGVFDVTATSLGRRDGYKTIELDPAHRTVLLTDPAARIDLGGITVGYVLDRVGEDLATAGVENFLLDIGGDIICRGENGNGRAWQVGIRDPEAADRAVAQLDIHNQSVTTSGNYVKRHIVRLSRSEDRSQTASITVVADTGIAADVLATAVFAMDPVQRRQFVRLHPEISVYAVQKHAGAYRVVRLR